jgi:hypothetical protein
MKKIVLNNFQKMIIHLFMSALRIIDYLKDC